MRTFKLSMKSVEVYMYIYNNKNNKIEFIWSPSPPYTTEQIAQINDKFVPWVKECLEKQKQ